MPNQQNLCLELKPQLLENYENKFLEHKIFSDDSIVICSNKQSVFFYKTALSRSISRISFKR